MLRMHASLPCLSFCTIISFLWVRTPDQPALVVQALPDTVSVAEWWYPVKHDLENLRSVVDSAGARLVHAQGFLVLEAYDYVSDSMTAPAPGDTVWIVKWDLSSMCGRIAPASWQWLPSGETVFLTATVRPDSTSVVKGRTLDHFASTLYRADLVRRQYENQVGWLRRLFTWSPMTARQFGVLYMAGATHAEWQADPQGTYSRVRRWLGNRPGMTDRHPAHEWIDELDRTLAHYQRQPD